MGLKNWISNAPKGNFSEFAVYKDGIARGRERHPLDDVVARVESGQALEKRLTLTRVVALGMFAGAAKKKVGGEVFLTIEGPGFFWNSEVNRKKANDARHFAGLVNDLARKHQVAS